MNYRHIFSCFAFCLTSCFFLLILSHPPYLWHIFSTSRLSQFNLHFLIPPFFSPSFLHFFSVSLALPPTSPSPYLAWLHFGFLLLWQQYANEGADLQASLKYSSLPPVSRLLFQSWVHRALVGIFVSLLVRQKYSMYLRSSCVQNGFQPQLPEKQSESMWKNVFLMLYIFGKSLIYY